VRDRLLRWETALIVLCVAAFGYGATSTPGFTDAGNIDFLLLDYTEVALLALALLPIVLTGEIDLSVASVLGFCSALTGVLWEPACRSRPSFRWCFWPARCSARSTRC
jgi:rhamnose transport system permease protein